MSAIANCLISASTAMLLHPWARWGVMSGLSILASFSHAVTFEVSTADEFQAALTTASNNGSDNTILLAPGLYVGNFAYIYNTPNKLVIESASTTAKPEETVIDGNDFAYSIFLNAKTAGTFELRRVKVMGGRSKEGASTIPVRGDNLASMVLEDVIVEDNVPEFSVPVDAKATEFVVRNSVIASANSDRNYYNSNPPRQKTVTIVDSEMRSVLISAAAQSVQITGSLFKESTLEVNLVNGSPQEGVEEQASLLIHDNTFSSQQSYSLLRVSNSGGFAPINDSPGEPRFQVTSNEIKGSSSFLYEVRVIGEDFSFEDNNLFEVRFEFGPITDENPGRVVGNTFTSSVGLESCEGNAFPPAIYASGGGQWFGNVISGLADVNARGTRFRNNVLISNVNVRLSVEDQVSNDSGLYEMIGNTFADNCSSINVSVATTTRLNLANNIFWGNGVDDGKKRDGVGLYFGGYGEELNAYNNIIDSHNAIWTNEEGNRSIDPKFYSPDSGDYHLSADSPGIDTGNNAYVASDDSVDADGNPRINGGTVDLGAYERTTGGLHPADTNGDSSISSDEFKAYNAAWRANDIWPTAPAVITADFVTRAGYLLQKGGDYKNIGVGKPQTWVPVNE